MEQGLGRRLVRDGDDFSFTQAYPDYDMRAVTATGKEGRSGDRPTKLRQHRPLRAANPGGFSLYEKLGIDRSRQARPLRRKDSAPERAQNVLKREWHDGQWMARHHLHVVEDTAKRHIAFNPHEPIKDTGLRRTYPNWISREGQRGMEYNAWGEPKNPPEHEANLVFTRMLGGPMDFTPGILSLKGRGNTQILSTLAKQLALYVVIYSPIQMAADLPENYEANPSRSVHQGRAD